MLLLSAVRLLGHLMVLYGNYKVLEESRKKAGLRRQRRRALRRQLAVSVVWAAILALEPWIDLACWIVPLYDQMKVPIGIVFLASRSLICEDALLRVAAIAFVPYEGQIDVALDIASALIGFGLALFHRLASYLKMTAQAARLRWAQVKDAVRWPLPARRPTTVALRRLSPLPSLAAAPFSPASDVDVAAALLSPTRPNRRARRSDYHGASLYPGSLLATPHPSRPPRVRRSGRPSLVVPEVAPLLLTPDIDRAALVFADTLVDRPTPPSVSSPLPAPIRKPSPPVASTRALPSLAGPTRRMARPARTDGPRRVASTSNDIKGKGKGTVETAPLRPSESRLRPKALTTAPMPSTERPVIRAPRRNGPAPAAEASGSRTLASAVAAVPRPARRKAEDELPTGTRSSPRKKRRFEPPPDETASMAKRTTVRKPGRAVGNRTTAQKVRGEDV